MSDHAIQVVNANEQVNARKQEIDGYKEKDDRKNEFPLRHGKEHMIQVKPGPNLHALYMNIGCAICIKKTAARHGGIGT